MVEESLPGGDHRQGQGGGLGHGEGRRLAADEPLVDSLKSLVGSGAVDGASVVDLIADREEGDGLAHGTDGARGVEAEDAQPIRHGPSAELDVNGVDGDGLDLDEEVVGPQLGDGDVLGEEAVGVGDG